MTDHDLSRQTPSKTASTPPAASRLRTPFTRARVAEFADKLGLSRMRQIPGIGWVIAIAAIALLIQGVGLANLIAVNEEKQQWSAAANHREGLLAEIRELETNRIAAKEEWHTIKGKIDHESGRLAEVQAGLKLTQQLRDEAQREQGAAANEANRLREANEALAAKSKELATRLATAEGRVTELEAARDRLTAEVNTSKLTLDEHRAESERAMAHAKEMDAKASATLEAIRKSREAQIKAQADLDEAVKQAAKAAAETEGAKTRLQGLNLKISESQTDVEHLLKQMTGLKTTIATDKKLAGESNEARVAAEAELVVLKDRLDRSGRTLAERQGAAAAEESLIAAAQSRQDALKSRVANLQAELKPLEEQRLSLEADIAGKRKELETLRERIDSARADLKSIPATAPPAPAPKPAPEAEKKEPAKPAEEAPKDSEESSSDPE